MDMVMDCKKAEALLVEYLYEELSPKKTVAVEKHLQACRRCAGTLERWRAIHDGFQKSDAPPVMPPYLRQRIMAAAEDEMVRTPSLAERAMFFLRPALLLPLLVFVVLTVIWTTRPPGVQQMAQKRQPAVAKPKGAVQPSSTVADKKTAESLERFDQAEPLRKAKMAERPIEAEREKAATQTPPLSYKGGAKIGGMEGKDYAPKEPPVAQQNAAFEQLPQEEKAESDYATAQHAQEGQMLRETPPPAAAAPVKQQLAKATAGTISDSEASFDEAQSLFRQNRIADGYEVANQAIRQDKDRRLAPQFYQEGQNYQSRNMPEQAIANYTLLVENYPSYTAEALLKLGDSYAQAGKLDDAKKAYLQLQQMREWRDRANQRLAEVEQRRQNQLQLDSLKSQKKQ
jgi:hypothetical protein